MSVCTSTIRNSRTAVKGGACTGSRGRGSRTGKLINVLFPSRSEDNSINDLLAKDPEFLNRVAARFQNLTHAIPFPSVQISTSLSLIHNYYQNVRNIHRSDTGKDDANDWFLLWIFPMEVVILVCSSCNKNKQTKLYGLLKVSVESGNLCWLNLSLLTFGLLFSATSQGLLQGVSKTQLIKNHQVRELNKLVKIATTKTFELLPRGPAGINNLYHSVK